MSDLISREKAIDYFVTNIGVVDADGYAVDDYDERVKIWTERFSGIPSVEPERKWIPFDVALPKDRQKVLCVNKHDEMMVGGYLTDYGMTFPCYFEKPVAWMPLVEPYGGEE